MEDRVPAVDVMQSQWGRVGKARTEVVGAVRAAFLHGLLPTALAKALAPLLAEEEIQADELARVLLRAEL